MGTIGMKRNIDNEFTREYRYASRHHLIPLYVLSGVLLVALIVTGCFVAVLWNISEQNAARLSSARSIGLYTQTYYPADVAPAEKKQYIYQANIKFVADNPNIGIRYNFDPGISASATKTSSTTTISTEKHMVELITKSTYNALSPNVTEQLQRCSRLFIIRFEPGVTAAGGFVIHKQVKLKDGRTAYIHKNSSCVPKSTQAMNDIDAVDRVVSSIESF